MYQNRTKQINRRKKSKGKSQETHIDTDTDTNSPYTNSLQGHHHGQQDLTKTYLYRIK